MTPAHAKRYVLVGVAGTGALAVVASYRRGDTPDVRIGVGTVAAGVLLSVLAELVPDLAGGLALLMLTGAALATGAGAWEGIRAATAPAPITPTT